MELGIIIAAFNKGLVSYFSINFEEDSIRILHLRDKQIHFDDVTYVFRKGSFGFGYLCIKIIFIKNIKI